MFMQVRNAGPKPCGSEISGVDQIESEDWAIILGRQLEIESSAEGNGAISALDLIQFAGRNL